MSPFGDRRGAASFFGPLLLLLCALAFFGWLAHEVLQGRTQAFDERWRAAVHACANPVLTLALRCVTVIGAPGFGVALAAALFWMLWKAHNRHAALLIVVTGGGAAVLDQVLKRTFERPRPEPFFGLAKPDSWSFPSGHALFSMSFYLLLAWLLHARLGPLARVIAWSSALALALLIGFTRVYLGVHYPSDVLGGYAVGGAWMLAVTLGDRWGRSRQPDRIDPAYLRHLRSEP